MLEVADIVRLHGAAYCARFGQSLVPNHLRALRDIQACRTPACGGHVHQCDECGPTGSAYHSCRNRHCPKCHEDQTERWLAEQRARLLPCASFLLTFTLPEDLRALARAHPKALYGLLMRSAAAALQTLALDPRSLGGRIGCLGVLHTWTRALRYHPHVHLLVTAGGLAADGTAWLPAKHPSSLVPVQALSPIFRATMCAALKPAGFLAPVPPGVWEKRGVVQCQPAGRGPQVLDYLGRYVFRVAIPHSRLERIEAGQVTFRYRDNRTRKLHRVTVSGVEFLHRFLQHVLPSGCTTVRYSGLWSPTGRPQLDQARALLGAPPAPAPSDPAPVTPLAPPPGSPPSSACCPRCRVGHLRVVAVLRPHRGRSPCSPLVQPPSAPRYASGPRVSEAVCLAGVSRRFLPTPFPPMPPSAGRLQPSITLLERRSSLTWLSHATPHRIEIPSTHGVPGFSSTPDFVAASATRILNLLGGNGGLCRLAPALKPILQLVEKAARPKPGSEASRQQGVDCTPALLVVAAISIPKKGLAHPRAHQPPIRRGRQPY